MPTIAEYEAWKASKQANEAGKANIVLSQPFPTEPDQFAADTMFAREASAVVGNPVPMSLVQDPNSRSVFEQIIAEKKRSTVLTQSPRLSEWLRAPDNAAVARDNLEGLSWWETFAGATGNAVIERGGMRVQQSYYQWLAEGAAQRAGDAERSFGDIYAEERANVGPVGNVLDNAIGPIGDLWNAGSRVVQSRLADMFGGDQEQAAAYYQQQVGIIGEKIAAMPMSTGAEKIRAQIGALEPSGDVVQDLTAFLGVATSDLAGFTAFLAETAAETAPVLAAGIGAGVVSRNPAVGAGVLGGGSYLQERYLAPSELLAERGIDISTPEGAMAAVTDPDLMREAAERGEIRGLIIGALDTISGGVAGETLARNPVLNMVLQSLVQAAFGGGGEAAAQVASGQQFNISDVLIEGLAEFVTAPIEVGGMAASSVREAMTKAPAAEQHAVTLTEMATRAAADPVRNRMPDAFRDYLRAAMANTGAENLFIPADQFVQYFQGAGVDPFELADQLTGMSRADVEMAAETGGSVKIPTATWAADMAGGEHDQFIISNSTFAPDAMTAQEAAEFNARAQDALQEAWEEAEALRIEAEELRQIYDQERDELIGRLRAAGRATDVAQAEALPMVEFRRVMAERMGLTPEEFAARYPLPQVQGERPEGLDPKNVDELTRTLAEARNRRAVGLEKRGPTLLEFIGDYGGIIDPGGALRARDAATVKRPGKKTLKLERGGARAVGDMFGLTGGKGYGFDDVARAAIEAGYLADDPVALEWAAAMREGREVPDIGRALLDAIDRELRGEQQYAGQAVEVEDGLAGIEEYLAGLGLSLDDGDDAIRAAIEGFAANGQRYGQAQGVDLTPGGGSKTYKSGDTTIDYGISRDGETAEIILVRTPRNARGRGSARKALGELLAAFDAAGLTTFLTAEPMDKGVTKGGLVDFYKSLGFVENKGRNKDFRSRAAMVRNPRTTLFQADSGFTGGGRGSIQFPVGGVNQGETLVSLFQKADLSTFLHESGHYFLTVLQDAAALDPSGPLAREFETVKAWWRDNADAVASDAGNGVTADDVRNAIDNGTSGSVDKDNAIDIGMQEQFARATEAYLMEGKAPSPSLRQAFEKFRAWLVSIYKTMRGLNVNVTDELRGVFDRMLATDDEIAAARTDLGADVQLTAADLGMTDEQFQSFLKLRDQAKADASAKLLAETMAPIKRAKQAEYKAEREKVRERIERETKQQPVYRAIQELRFGRDFDGNAVDAPLKLDRAIIEGQYGAGYVPYLPGATKDGAGHKNAVFASDGGVHPDIAAGAYGFKTGKDMLDALANAPDMDALIESETNLEMERRFNDPLKDGSVEALAVEAVHGDARARELEVELEAMNEIAGTDRGMTAKETKEIARRTLRGMTVRDATRPDRFLAAERKAAGEVARLASTVTRDKMWMDRARRRVETQARGALREGDGAQTLTLPVERANQTTQRFNEDAARLVEAKRRQLLNHALYSEAVRLTREQQKFERRLSLLRKTNKRISKIRDINFIYAARTVAGRFGLTKPVKDFDFNSWLEQLRFDDPITAASMTSIIDTYSQDARPYRDLTVMQYGAVKDAVDSLLAMSKTTREIEINGQKVARRDALDAMIAKAEPRSKLLPGATAAPTKREKNFLDALTTGSALVRAEAWARDMDDGEAGVFTRYIIRPVMDALGAYRAARTERMAELLAIVEPRRGELLGARISAPELNYEFENKGALLHALLHTGNDSNKRKLLLGRGWSPGMTGQKQAVSPTGKPRVDRNGNPIMDKGVLDTARWDAFVDRMIREGTITAADKKMIEDIWTLMDRMKRPAQAAHKKMYGHYFQEVEAQPFTNALGTWRGGYVPAIIDDYASVDAGKQDANAALDSQMDASMFPSTGSGFTKSRVEYNQPLALNLQSLPGHMDKVLRFTHLEPAIRQTSSLVTDKGLRSTVAGVNRDAIDNIVVPWLVRSARQSVETQATTPYGRKFNGVMRELRKRVGLHMMALNIVNAMQQVTGIPSAAVLVKTKHLKGAMVRYAKDARNMASEAVTASAMMRDRMDNSSRVTSQEIDKIIVEPTVQAEVDRFVNQHGYILQQGMQNVVDVVVWHGAYDQAIQTGMSNEDAVFEADSVVRRTQGSFNPEDISAFESGTALVRLLTMFTSYFNTQLNLIGGEAATAVRTKGWRGATGRLSHLYFFGVLIPAVVAEAISEAARGELGDEDDDGLTDDMLELFIGSQVKFVAGAIPFVGALTVAALNKFNDQPFDDKLSASPAQYTLERAVGAPASIARAVAGEGSASKAVSDGVSALGLILGVPTGQLAKSMGYIVGVGEGRSEPQNAVDFVKGLMSGRDGSE